VDKYCSVIRVTGTFVNAEGVHKFQPRVDARRAATLGNDQQEIATLKGVAGSSRTYSHPFQGWTFCFVLITQGSALTRATLG
jgi:hypothetical protein